MAAAAIRHETLSDSELVARAVGGDTRAVRLITTRNNQRLYRAAWSVLKHRGEAEEAVQETYLKAFTGRAVFDGRSALSTWLTRIAFNEALERKRAAARRKRSFAQADVALMEEYRERFVGRQAPSPEAEIVRAQVGALLEEAIARLPEEFRTVFVLREIEDMSVEETANALALAPQTVKTRLFRARAKLRRDLGPELKAALNDAFQFAGAACARLTQRTLAALGLVEAEETHHD